MPFSSAASAAGGAENVSRPMVKGLFVASCLLSLVSWYTTQQGMALYLSSGFAFLASLGVQAALVLVAWLIGFTRSRRILLISVYAITALVSIGFSYVSLFTWFSARERPAAVERKLYDTLNDTAGRAQNVLSAAVAEQQKHVLALEEMTRAENSVGYVSRAQDADPYLANVRAAVAKEAQTYSGAYHEGAGSGLRYSAFERYTGLARQSLERLQAAQNSLAGFRSSTKPLDPTEKQLRAFRQVYDGIPWTDVEQDLHSGKTERPPVPNYADFIDRSVSGQEDLMVAFEELFTAPTGRHIFSFTLAAFIDVIVFLLAYASGPYFFGAPEQRWLGAGAALDGLDNQAFVRNLLAKVQPGPRGCARLDSAGLSSGEQQVCLLLAAKGLALPSEQGDRLYYLLDQRVHEHLAESVAAMRFPLRWARSAPRA